jgi:hypothetical protein
MISPADKVAEIADPGCRHAVERAIAAMRKAAEMRPLPDYGILLALRNGAEAIEQFNDPVAARTLAEVAVVLTSHPKISLDTARGIVKQGYALAVEARVLAAERRRDPRTVRTIPRSKTYQVPELTLAALDAAFATDDPASIRSFLRGRPRHELKEMYRYLRGQG